MPTGRSRSVLKTGWGCRWGPASAAAPGRLLPTIFRVPLKRALTIISGLDIRADQYHNTVAMSKMVISSQDLSLEDVTLPAVDERTPEMQDLTDLQARFVMAMVITGAQNATECARIAGYGGGAKAQQVRGHELIANPKIIRAFKAEAAKRLEAGVLIGASVIMEIALDPGHKDRLKAAESLLNRGGMALITKHEHDVNINDTRSTKQLEAYIVHMAKQMKMDPVKLLGYSPDATDAEFTEVIDAPDAEKDDLSDLLGDVPEQEQDDETED